MSGKQERQGGKSSSNSGSRTKQQAPRSSKQAAAADYMQNIELPAVTTIKVSVTLFKSEHADIVRCCRVLS